MRENGNWHTGYNCPFLRAVQANIFFHSSVHSTSMLVTKNYFPILNPHSESSGWLPELHSSSEGSDFVVLKSHLHTLLDLWFSNAMEKGVSEKSISKGEESYSLKLDHCIWHTPNGHVKFDLPIRPVKMKWFRTINAMQFTQITLRACLTVLVWIATLICFSGSISFWFSSSSPHHCGTFQIKGKQKLG